MPSNVPRLIIAAPSSGSGKTTVAAGLMAAFVQHLRVQGFKVGPDYIDPMYHAAATGCPARNLDAWMLPPAVVRRNFLRAAAPVQLSLIEGVMGLFDGFGADPLEGSTAHIAQLLDAPVVLVVDCARMSVSAAAVVHGFHTFMPKVNIAGVICNYVGGERHAAWLREVIERYGLPVLGCLPNLPNLTVPDRHLGLLTVAERPQETRRFLAAAREAMAHYLNLDQLLALAQAAPPLPLDELEDITPFVTGGHPPTRIGVARDEAFCFYYEDNFDALRRQGAEILYFSPLHDAALPDGVAGLYFGGGYPELYAEPLSANAVMRAAVAEAHRQGMPIYAECGGLMYLTEAIRAPDGRLWPMTGLLPGHCRLSERLTMGYREVALARDGLLGETGRRLRGHEFHYSDWENHPTDCPAYEVHPHGGRETPYPEGIARRNLHASYIHVHFGQDERLAANLVNRCRAWQAGVTV